LNKRRASWSKILLSVTVVVGVALGGAVHHLHSPTGATALARYVSGAATSPDMKIEIASIDDVLSSHPALRDLTVADRDGVWLKIDRVTMQWSRLALLALRLDVESVEVGEINLLRRPLPAREAAAPPPAKSGGSPFANLPIRVRLGELTLAKIDLGEPVLGVAARFAVKGAADLGLDRNGSSLRVAADRTDAPGSVVIDGRFDPSGNRLDLKIAASEPEGGVIARLAQLPGLPPVDIALDGAGPLDGFEAKLAAKAGEAIGAEGLLRISREGADRKLLLTLESKLAALLPKDLAALFAETTKLDGAARLGADGAATLDRLSLQASAFALDATGGLAANGDLSGQARLHGLPPTADALFGAKSLDGEALVSGSLARPDATLRFLVEDAVGPMGRLGHVDLTAKAVADGDLAKPQTRLDVLVKGAAFGLALSDAGLAEAIGDGGKLTLQARVAPTGDADVETAKIEVAAGEASFSGKAGPAALDGKSRVAIRDLQRLARLAGRSLRGALNFSAELSGAPAQGVVEAKLLGGVDGPSAGVEAFDGLLGQRLSLGGKVATLPGGGFAIDKLEAKGDHLRLLVDGRATQDAADVTATLALPDLKRADARLGGRGDVEAKLSGSLAKPDATFSANILGASVNGRSVPKLGLTGAAQDLTGALVAQLRLDGVVDGKKAVGRVDAARAGTGWKIDDLDVAIGRASVKGNVALAASGVASGRVVVSAPDLDDFSALALQSLAGRLNADVTLEEAGGGQNVALAAEASGIKAQGAQIDKASAKFSARDLLRRPMFDGDLSVDGAHVGAETISKLRVSARPAGAGAAALDLSVDARGYALLGRATLTHGERMRLDIAQFSARRGDKQIALASPAAVSFYRGVVDIKGLALALGSGRLELDGSVGERLDLTARARAVPLSVAALADPSLTLEGTLDAEARVTGTKSAPAGDWKVKLAKAMAPQLRANGLPAVDASASGRLAGQRTTLDADIALGAASKLKITGSAPLGAGALELAIKGVIDAALANTMLAANGQTAAGKANVDLRISGAANNPQIGGAVALADGAFNDPLNGFALSKISGRIEGRGRDLNIAALTAQTKNGGQLAITGHVTVNPEAGMPGSIHIGAQKAQLANSDVVSSIGDLDITIAGPLLKAPKVSGRVTLGSMDVSVPDRMPANLKPLPGGVHIDAKGFAAQMLALEKKAKAQAAKHSSFDAGLDLAISAPNRIFVRGRGIDAEFGGDLKVVGTVQKPNVIGGFDLRRGKLQLLTQRIDITRGKLTFIGGFMPELDFTASTTAGDVTATIGIQGPASLPGFAFSSTPELPQDEVLSRLLFAKASGSLTPFQAVQLATALAQFSGAATGVDAFEKMRKALGVDSLDLDAGGTGGPSIGASRYIMEGVNVGVKTGAKPEQSAVSVGVDLMKGVRAQGETRMDGKTSVGVGMEWEY